MFSLDIGLIVWILLGVAMIFAVVGIFLWPLRKSRNPEHAEGCNRAAEEGAEPLLSVILYSENDDLDTISGCVSALREQQMEGVEIVVVCRGSMASRDMIAGHFADLPGVYVTFIPADSHNLSERKLAITLGLKAAKADVVLTTSTNILIGSPCWLEKMYAPFEDPEVEIVLGYSHQDFSELRGLGRWYKQYDTVMESSSWIGSALSGHPYRGDGYNLAFRRSTFFAHKGYAKNIYLHYGDDDLFVSEIATADNTRVVIDPDAQLTTEWGREAGRMWRYRKERYMFTSRWLPKMPFVRSGMLSACQWIVTGCCIAAMLLGLPSIIPAIIGALIWAAFQISEIYIYRPVAKALGAVRLWWALPLFMHLRPLENLLFRLRHRGLGKKYYTWSR